MNSPFFIVAGAIALIWIADFVKDCITVHRFKEFKKEEETWR